MTTAIRDGYAPLDSALIGRSGQGVYVGIDKTNLPHRADVIIPRDEFLAAVATELDVIVIPRSDLPELKGWEVELLAAGAETSDDAWMNALHYLAAAEHLEKNPPIDEAAVDALAAVLSNEGDGGIWEHFDTTTSREVARRLVAAGVRAPQAGDDQ